MSKFSISRKNFFYIDKIAIIYDYNIHITFGESIILNINNIINSMKGSEIMKEKVMASQIFNDVWLYVAVFAIIVFVVIQSLIFMRKAWNRALGLGIAEHDLKNTLLSGITISIMPTLPVLIVFLALTPLLGSPLPWLRLSVIGSAHYESYAAGVGVQSIGEELLPEAVSMEGWIIAAWVMTVGGSACVLWSSLAIKPISIMYAKLEEKMDKRFVNAIGAGALGGIMAFVTVSFGLSDISGKGIVFCISFLTGAFLVFIRGKFKNAKWLGEFLMTISMIAAMAAACFIF